MQYHSLVQYWKQPVHSTTLVSASSAAINHVEVTVTVSRAVWTFGVMVMVDRVMAVVVGPVVIVFASEAAAAAAMSEKANDFISKTFN